MLSENHGHNQEILSKLLAQGKNQEVADLLIQAMILCKQAKNSILQNAIVADFAALMKSDLNILKNCLIVVEILDEKSAKDNEIKNETTFIRKRKNLIELRIHNCLLRPSSGVDEIYKEAISLFGINDVCKYLADIRIKIDTVDDYRKMIKDILSLNLPDKEKFLERLVGESLQCKNLLLLQAINMETPAIFEKVSSSSSLKPFSAFMCRAINEIKSLEEDEESKHWKLNLMAKMVAGIGFLDYDAGLLAIAAKYNGELNKIPIIIDSSNPDELNRMFGLLKEGDHPNSLKFAMSGSHWPASLARVDANGNLQLFIIDSLGMDVNPETKMEVIRAEGRQIIQAAREKFSNIEIFVNDEKRQNAVVGCSVFAIDDALHLNSVEKYLDEKVYGNDLFNYLKKNSKKELPFEGAMVSVVDIPLYLKRTMQSSKLIDQMKQGRPGETVLNKKGVTPQSFAASRQGFFSVRGPKGVDREENQRLETQLEKMQHKCLDLLVKNDADTVKNKMHECSIGGLTNRLQKPDKEMDDFFAELFGKKP